MVVFILENGVRSYLYSNNDYDYCLVTNAQEATRFISIYHAGLAINIFKSKHENFTHTFEIMEYGLLIKTY